MPLVGACPGFDTDFRLDRLIKRICSAQPLVKAPCNVTRACRQVIVVSYSPAKFPIHIECRLGLVRLAFAFADSILVNFFGLGPSPERAVDSSPNLENQRLKFLKPGRHLQLACMLRGLCFMVLLATLSACAPRLLVVNAMADELAGQGQGIENDLVLVRDASPFYLKLSESLLKQTPGHTKLAEAVASGFTQYAYAFVSFEAEKVESVNAGAAQALRERAARLYLRAHLHAMTALAQQSPGFAKGLFSPIPANWPRLSDAQVGLAYWAAASWGGYIALSKDGPEIVADLPVALRLAGLAYAKNPDYGDGALAGLMGTFEASRPGGSRSQALAYFDSAIHLSRGTAAGFFLGKAESLALQEGDKDAFAALLERALAASAAHPSLENEIMRARALWLSSRIDELF